ncbi:uncharacterized protein LOC120419870 [Culex pipiens pallens]|uniref:uncharacterized protein LOC120419870 n=1 Tax=Culex pipiens pallens TaxID=42434 RepID=UPI0019539C43|nr:uncharacterized protein LOC120419870 [Culex pipiens pallens]
MGSSKYQCLIAIVLLSGINSIDTQQHSPGMSNNNREETTTTFSDEFRLLNKQGARNSYAIDNESAAVGHPAQRHRRSVGSGSSSSSTGQTGSQNLCNMQGCSCSNQPILTIDCEVFGQLTLDGRYNIPREAKSLNIQLNVRATRLHISSKLFENSLLNRVLIKGNYNNGGSSQVDHVEFLAKAFCLNNGTYPQLEVVNVHTVVFHSQTFCQEFNLNVTRAAEVVIMQSAFSVPESEILLNGVKDIRIQDDAFRGSVSTKLDIVNCGIGSLCELRASFKEIRFINTNIKEVLTKAFDVNKIDSLVFENCNIGVLKSQAVTEKLLCKHFTVTGCKIGTIEREFISESGLVNFILQNNTISEIAPEAIRFTGVTSKIIQNKIIKTGINWFFQNGGWTSVAIVNNSFGEFNYFTMEETEQPSLCQFHGNSVTLPAIRSFSFFHHQACTLREISFNRQCTCDERWMKELFFQDYDKLLKESYCRIDETLKHCYNASTFNVKKYTQQVCNESTRSIDCSSSQKEKKVEPNFVSPTEIEDVQYQDYYQYIVMGASAIVAIVIVVLCILFRTICSGRQSAASGDVVSNASFTMTHKPSKAFTKEDKSIIHQTLQKIKEKQSPDTYEDIFIHTKKLLDGNSTETEKVLTIGEIVRRLNECENSGDDFVAFTDILYRHLAPSTSATPLETIYAEPSAPAEGMTVIGGVPGGTPDHIYAELTSAAQPLLINEYAAPMDLSDSHYSEPVQIMHKDNTRTLITPYAIGNNISGAVQHPQPGTSRNLPDILNSGNSSTTNSSSSNSNTTANAMIVAGGPPPPLPEPLRYMDRSPTSSREIPEYTLPAKKVPPKPAPRREPSEDSDSSGTSHSEHSGGSDITVKIDDIVEYADA